MKNNTTDALTKIENFVKNRYEMAINNNDAEERWFLYSQAYGAIEFFIEEHPELEGQPLYLWEFHYAGKFEDIIL